jgi:peptide/nickel transport system ATP-binding protein
MEEKILEVNDLKINFKTDGKEFTVVNNISFYIKAGETLGVVGESGCGKSVTALSIMKLLATPPGIYAGGNINYLGENILKKKEKEMRKLRGNEISMIFQEPMTSLNPVITVGDQIDEVLLLHNKMSKAQAQEGSINMLKLVGIPRPEEIYKCYAYELSGGMRQRIMIAIGLACQPKLLIADEPTTALDVTIQAQILDLMRDLKEKTNTAIMFITHDLGVVAEMCDRVMVMYSGEVVEEADVYSLFKEPKHPYTKGLLESIPKLGDRKKRLKPIPGQVPAPGSIEVGCKFADRCPFVMDVCRQSDPPLLEVTEGHMSRCWLYEEEAKELEISTT